MQHVDPGLLPQILVVCAPPSGVLKRGRSGIEVGFIRLHEKVGGVFGRWITITRDLKHTTLLRWRVIPPQQRDIVP